MAKITRFFQKQFGSTGLVADFGQYGSLAAASPTNTKDPATIQGLSQFLDGWASAIVGDNSPALEDMNSLFFLAFRQLAYLLQSGIPEWETNTVYYKGSLVTVADDSGRVYVSITNDNTGNAVTDPEHWKPFVDEKAQRPLARIISGSTRASGQPAFLVPAGVGNGASLSIDATTAPFVGESAGVPFSFSSDASLGSLTTAPATNNTCLVNDSAAAGSLATRSWGEEFNYVPNSPHKKEIQIGTIGSEISSKNGDLAAFRNETSGEIMLARIDTTNTRLHKIFRGFFYDNNIAPINRGALNNTETLTLMSLGWVYMDADGTTVDVTYLEPIHSDVAPAATSGQYWHDKTTNTIKKGNGSTFDIVDRVFAGLVVLDDTDCIAARSADFDAEFKTNSAMEIERISDTVFRVQNVFSKINVYGKEIEFGSNNQNWDMTSDLAPSSDMYSATEQASRQYFFYRNQNGGPEISDIPPYVRRDLGGLYHPHNPWLCIGSGFNNGSSNLSFPVYLSLNEKGYLESGWSEPELTVIGASVTPPTKGTTSIDEVFFRFLGNGSIEAIYSYAQGAGTAGSGTYLFSLPNGFKSNTNVVNSGVSVTAAAAPLIPGQGTFSGAAGGIVAPFMFSQTQFGMFVVSDAASGTIGSGFGPFSSPSEFNVKIEVPISAVA